MVRAGFVAAFFLLSLLTSRAESKTAIVLACGNAFGTCNASSLPAQMRRVLGGIPAQLFPVNWGGKKWNVTQTGPIFGTANLAGLLKEPPLVPIVAAINRARRSGFDKILVAGQSAGGWAVAMAGILMNVDGIISYYGPLDLARLWQRGQWGKLSSPRGPLLYLMPFGAAGCTNCSNPFPAGDAPIYSYDVQNPMNSTNGVRALQLLAASPWYYFGPNSPRFFATQGSEDGIIGQYQGRSQAEHLVMKNGARPGDALVLCPGVAHGYPFDAAFTTCRNSSGATGSPQAFLRQWIQSVVQ